MADELVKTYPAGFRPRRGLNWGADRADLRVLLHVPLQLPVRDAGNGRRVRLQHPPDHANLWARGRSPTAPASLFNGLLSDRIGGKTIDADRRRRHDHVNLIFGFSSFAGTFATFGADLADQRLMQSFGAPGMVKINAAWFRRTERGTFAGIFGFMIQLGQFAIN